MKERCECELFVEKYFGIGPVNERTPIEADYGQLVNLLTMFRDEMRGELKSILIARSKHLLTLVKNNNDYLYTLDECEFLVNVTENLK